MSLRRAALVMICWLVLLFPARSAFAQETVINFDDVEGDEADITRRYEGLGVVLQSIDNPFPRTGAFPAPATLPPVRGGVTTWLRGFESALSAPHVAVSAPAAGVLAGNRGILISFAYDVTSVSLVGNDLGTGGTADAEGVTLTAYNAAGNRIGQVYVPNTSPAIGFDRTPATISLAGIRHVAFNYTNTNFGFYAIDDLRFTGGPGVSVGGVVTLQQAVNAAQPVRFTFRPQTGNAFTRTATLGANGSYNLFNIPPGEYQLSIKGAKWLRKNLVIDARLGSVTNATATLLAGDANDDNFADITDLLAVIAAYNQLSPNAGYSAAADFNSDGANDVVDLLLLISNYNKQGDS
jgi:hypothetical protein